MRLEYKCNAWRTLALVERDTFLKDVCYDTWALFKWTCFSSSVSPILSIHLLLRDNFCHPVTKLFLSASALTKSMSIFGKVHVENGRLKSASCFKETDMELSQWTNSKKLDGVT
jgi:hypothetical protein